MGAQSMFEESREGLDAKIDAVLNYAEILKEAKVLFGDSMRAEITYMAIFGWLTVHVVGLKYKIKESLAFRLRQDLWNKTDPDKLQNG